MMRCWTFAVMVTLGLGRCALAVEDQVYRWTDKGGRLHFSNVPAPGAEPTGIVSDESLPLTPPSADGQGVEGAPPPSGIPNQESDLSPPPDGEDASPHVSIERQQLERQIKDAERQLHAVDTRLGSLAAARTRFAKGGPVAGGLATNAAGFQSEEEKDLAKQRESLSDNVERLRGDYGKLRAEVTTAAGGATPDWWIEP